MANRRNPYPFEIAYDQHVWLPRANGHYVSMADAPTNRAELQATIENQWPEITMAMPVHPSHVETALMQRLSPEEIETVIVKCKELGLDSTEYNILHIATHEFPHLREKLGTTNANPSEGIHWMQRGTKYYIGDIYSSNMMISTLAKRNLKYEGGKRYLDFGCSSGSYIRAVKAFEPSALHFGADPLQSSIDWANSNIPGATFLRSELKPPLPFEDGFFDGVTAVSIWSHFGEKEAIAWFDEMHRCIKRGGWLCFTTHGRVSVGYYNKREMLPEHRIRALFEGLTNSDFVFEETYIGESPEGIDATGYGNAYFTREWVLRSLSDKWDLVSHDIGTNQANQDIYILKAKGGASGARTVKQPDSLQLGEAKTPVRAGWLARLSQARQRKSA